MRKITNEELNRPTLEQYKLIRKVPCRIVLDNIRSAQNVGSFFRTADAFSMEGIDLCGITAVPPSRDIHKSSLGAEFSVEWRHFASTLECVTLLKEQGYRVFSVEQVENSLSLENFHPTFDNCIALVFGNEVMGVDQQVVDLCDGALEIPQRGTKHSLNVSVAGGVVLWKVFESFQTK
ncbi:MAG: RNA methyltransferase [Alistipes sp.]|nr:RNA methyltransferase [Candidatus Alistipes equi]